MISPLVVTVFTQVTQLLEIAVHYPALSLVIRDKTWTYWNTNTGCMKAWSSKCDLICSNISNIMAVSHHRSWYLKKQNKHKTFLFAYAKSSKVPENCGLTLREQINRHTITLCPICLDSRRKLPDILPVDSKCTRCFLSAACKRPWHIHPFCCYCARAQLLRGKGLRDTVCSAGWAVSASGRANKQLLKRTAVVSDAFRGRTRWLSHSSLCRRPAVFLPTQCLRDAVTEDVAKDGPIVVKNQSIPPQIKWKHKSFFYMKKKNTEQPTTGMQRRRCSSFMACFTLLHSVCLSGTYTTALLCFLFIGNCSASLRLSNGCRIKTGYWTEDFFPPEER